MNIFKASLIELECKLLLLKDLEGLFLLEKLVLECLLPSSFVCVDLVVFDLYWLFLDGFHIVDGVGHSFLEFSEEIFSTDDAVFVLQYF